MIEALQIHGALKGTLLGLWRILRCHPFGAKGYDPVPEKGRWRARERWRLASFKSRFQS